MNTVGLYAWHVHHDRLYQKLAEPLEHRVKYIKELKPPSEIRVRIKLLKIVQSQDKLELLDAKYEAKLKSLDAHYKTKLDLLDAEYEAKLKSLDAHYKTKLKLLNAEYEAKLNYKTKLKLLDAEYEAKLKPLSTDILRLHAQECPDCPWNGKTIFPSSEKS